MSLGRLSWAHIDQKGTKAVTSIGTAFILGVCNSGSLLLDSSLPYRASTVDSQHIEIESDCAFTFLVSLYSVRRSPGWDNLRDSPARCSLPGIQVGNRRPTRFPGSQQETALPQRPNEFGIKYATKLPNGPVDLIVEHKMDLACSYDTS